MKGQEPSNRTELAAGLGWTGLMLNAKPILGDIFRISSGTAPRPCVIPTNEEVV
jgi:hypothetical protein